MVEDSNSTSEENSKSNKGVNVRSESLPARVHRYPESDTSCTTNDPRSLADIKNEIQNVLDLMGPTTPNLTTSCCNTSSEADNEESMMSVLPSSQTTTCPTISTSEKNTSCSNTTSKTKKGKKTKTPSSVTDGKDSMVADFGTYQSNIFDDLDENVHLCLCNDTHVCHPESTCLMPPCPCVISQQHLTAPSRTCEVPRKSPSKLTTTTVCKKTSLFEWLKTRSHDLLLRRQNNNPCELYKINICGQEDEGGPPKKVVFDLVDGIPRPTVMNVATNTIRNPIEKVTSPKSSSKATKEIQKIENETVVDHNKVQKNVYYDSEGNARVDYYYFDHGNAQFLHTTDTPPVMKCEIIAEKTERYTTRFWAEVFASIHIGISFIVSFILQLFKFILYSILRPVLVGLIQMLSDYLLKPLLTTLFNGLIQPILIFVYNIATSIRDLCDPVAEAVGYFCRELAVLLRAIRLCTYKKNAKEESCDCAKKNKCEC